MANIWTDIEEDEEIEKIARRILKEIEEIEDSETKDLKNSAFAKSISQLSDINYVKRLLKNIDLAHTKPVCTIEKLDVIRGLVIVTWLQRTYSTIRSLLLGVTAALVIVPILLYFDSLTLIQNVLLVVPIFVLGVIITRLLDNQIIRAARRTVKFLSTRKRLRKIIMNNF
jgi:VIT1/CCC1 family predicted Fe2+/Mn2+ transporter